MSLWTNIKNYFKYHEYPEPMPIWIHSSMVRHNFRAVALGTRCGWVYCRYVYLERVAYLHPRRIIPRGPDVWDRLAERIANLHVIGVHPTDQEYSEDEYQETTTRNTPT